MAPAAVVAGLATAVSTTGWADTRKGAARSSSPRPPVAKAATTTKTKKPPDDKSYGRYPFFKRA